VEHFAAPFAYLGSVYLQRGLNDKAVEANMRARSFMQERHRWDFALATMYSRAAQYDNALAMLDSFAASQGQNQPAIYTQIAQYAANNGHYDQAARIIEKSLEIDSKYREGYASLFMVHNTAGEKDKAIQVLERFIRCCPGDTAAGQALENYRASGQIDMNRVFGVASR